jgi:hypothetical protein
MSRRTQIKRTINRAIERRLQREQPTPPRTRWRVAKTLLFVIGIPGIVAGVLTLLPRASISAGEPLIPDDPFSAPFEVANDGYVDLNDVTFSCLPKEVDTDNFWVVKGGDNLGLTETTFNVGTLGPDGRTTLRCGFSRFFDFKGANITKAHIAMRLTFRPEWMPWRRSITRDFILTKDNSNHFRWLQRAF